MKRVVSILVLAVVALTLIQCGNSKKEKKEEKKQEEQLNITVLLDLSDRIDPKLHPNTPEHYLRDIAIVNELALFFKDNIEKKGGYKAKGRMRVVFSPVPQDTDINNIVSEMNIDLSKYGYNETQQKKKIFDNILTIYSQNLEKVYQTTISTKKFLGSDVWRFFKNDVKDYCVASEPHYRNILVILTDGYLYHVQSKDIQGNRSAFLTPTSLQNNGLRNKNWREKFEQGDYGFISTRSDLENLEVLVLEVNPSAKNIGDEDVIRAYFEKWFKEMNVKRFEIYNTDLPSNTKTRIEKFLK